MTRMLDGLRSHDTLGQGRGRLGPFDIGLSYGKTIRQKDHQPIKDQGRNGIEARGGEIEIMNRYGKLISFRSDGIGSRTVTISIKP
ncbi:hypothetical protein J3O30_17035 [Rhizobium sp. NZLR1]|nr:hypothetical protein J3O30_17035 [Rhizobium sp. NZLR1]